MYDTRLGLHSTTKLLLKCPVTTLFRDAVLQEERTFEDYLAYLPPIEIATSQVVLTTLLGSVHHTKCVCIHAMSWCTVYHPSHAKPG